MDKLWTKEEVWEHLKTNLTEKAGSYSAAVVVAALYKKIYGEFPKIGLSGMQAACANEVLGKLPPPAVEKPAPDKCELKLPEKIRGAYINQNEYDKALQSTINGAIDCISYLSQKGR